MLIELLEEYGVLIDVGLDRPNIFPGTAVNIGGGKERGTTENTESGDNGKSGSNSDSTDPTDSGSDSDSGPDSSRGSSDSHSDSSSSSSNSRSSAGSDSSSSRSDHPVNMPNDTQSEAEDAAVRFPIAEPVPAVRALSQWLAVAKSTPKKKKKASENHGTQGRICKATRAVFATGPALCERLPIAHSEQREVVEATA